MPKENPGVGKGSLLLANGSLYDPNFLRSVVLLCEHNENGSYGLVLNRVLDLRLSAVFPDNPILRNSQEKLIYGGPCDRNRIQVLHNCPSDDLDSFQVGGGIYLGGNFEAVIRMKAESPISVVCRFFSGYSGWGEGQLDKEIEAKSWIAHSADEKTVFHSPLETLWKSLLVSKGNYYAFVAQMPEEPRAN
jgi:putative transcriptional regulator